MKKVTIHTPFIKLNQLLKWANIVQTGAEASEIIKQGLVSLNGSVEYRRGKKVYVEDKVRVDGYEEFLVVGEGSADFVPKGADADKL